MLSEKYGCTYHYPLSPGATSNDQINHTYWEGIREINTLIHTEKLDGENNCLGRYRVFACLHIALTISPWTSQLHQCWELLKNDLGDIELLGENLYATHFIEYKRLETYFYVFAARCLDKWLSREEVKFYVALCDPSTVPELCTGQANGLTAEALKQHAICLAGELSVFGPRDVLIGMGRIREGVVTRNAGKYLIADSVRNVFEYVRQGYVQIDEHRTWHRKHAHLAWESKQEKGGNE